MAGAILRILNSHELASQDRLGSLRRWAFLRLRQSLSSGTQVVTYGEGARLHVQRRAATTELNHICGLRDYTEMMLLLHVSRPDDLILDIGANVGTYTVLAAYCARTSVIAVEPAPATVKRLEANLRLNGVAHRVRVVPSCVSEAPGQLQFSAAQDTINHVATEREPDAGKISVASTIIDELCVDRIPLLMKIDVEGYELPALRGAAKTINDPTLKLIIIEVNASGARYGFDDDKIDELLSAAGFSTYTYHPKARTFAAASGNSSENRIYIRDIDWVRQRVQNARPFRINSLTV